MYSSTRSSIVKPLKLMCIFAYIGCETSLFLFPLESLASGWRVFYEVIPDPTAEITQTPGSREIVDTSSIKMRNGQVSAQTEYINSKHGVTKTSRVMLDCRKSTVVEVTRSTLGGPSLTSKYFRQPSGEWWTDLDVKSGGRNNTNILRVMGKSYFANVDKRLNSLKSILCQ